MYGSLTTAGLFPETGFQMFFALHFHPVADFSPLPPVLTSSGACLLSPGGGVFLAQGRVRNQGERGRRDGEPCGTCQSSGRVAAGSFGLSWKCVWLNAVFQV